MQKVGELGRRLAAAVVVLGLAAGAAWAVGAGAAGASPVTTTPSLTGTSPAASAGTSPAGAAGAATVPGGGAGQQAPVTASSPAGPQSPTPPSGTAASAGPGSTISVNLGGTLSKPSQSITIIIALTLLAVAPSLLILLTSFTRIIIVLSLTRQALGLTNVPPNQLLAGLALFLSLFVMSPVISQVNHDAVQPYLAGRLTATQAYTDAQAPIKKWMLEQTQADDLAIFEKVKPATPSAAPMAAVVPAFALSEMRSAFIIGFVVFVPFLIIDFVVSATLMSLGMMMLPPSLVSLPFKLLLFVLVDGWALVVQSLLSSFHPFH